VSLPRIFIVPSPDSYYSLLIEDPNGIRLEWNYVPGKGLFDQAGGEGLVLQMQRAKL
jgi:hypothetical protein